MMMGQTRGRMLAAIVILSIGLVECTLATPSPLTPPLSLAHHPTLTVTASSDQAHVETGLELIALVSSHPGNEKIHLATPDGAHITSLTTGSQPAWSPDSSQLAFVDGDRGSQKIFIINVDGSGKKRLTDTPESTLEQNPTWSPDGKFIAFEIHIFLSSDDLAQRSDIYITSVTEGIPIRMTDDTTTHNLYPAWSPDGSRIAFVSLTGSIGELYLMNPDGSDWQQLTHFGSGVWNPAWSPDGEHIVFGAEPPDEPDRSSIYIINANGSGITRLTNNPERNDWDPSWSPDGTQLVFDA